MQYCIVAVDGSTYRTRQAEMYTQLIHHTHTEHMQHIFTCATFGWDADLIDVNVVLVLEHMLNYTYYEYRVSFE